MKNLYYTIKEETYSDGMENGLITINIYKIVGGDLKRAGGIETSTNSPFTYEEEIQEWVDELNEEEEYNYIRL